jgi:hypothetical protein
MDDKTREYRDFEQMLTRDMESESRSLMVNPSTADDGDKLRLKVLRMRIKCRDIWVEAGHQCPNLGFSVK